MILYTFAMEPVVDVDRWQDTGIRDYFSQDLDDVRQQVLDLRAEALGEANYGDSDQAWRPMRIERVEISPLLGETVVTLLNSGIGPLVQSYEVVEVIS